MIPGIDALIGATRIPAFAAGVRFRFDHVRKAWVVLAPERLFLPDEWAVAALRLVDGRRSFEDIVKDLAARYGVEQEVIAGDVGAMLLALADKGVIRLWAATK